MSDRSLDKFAWLESLRGADLTHAEYRVAVNLCTYARRDLTNAYPGFGTLCADARANEKTVKKALANLIVKGWVLRVRPATGRRPAVYALTLPQRGAQAPTVSGGKRGSEAPAIDEPQNGIAGVSVPNSGGLSGEIAGVSVGPDQCMNKVEINNYPRRDIFVDAAEAESEPTAPTPSDAGLFDLDDSDPIDAELVDELAPSSGTKLSKPATPEQRVTVAAYERTGKAFKFVAVRGIAKWAIHDRGEDPAAVEEALVGIHELGRPITKQTVGQWLDGILSPSGVRPGGMSKQEAKVLGYLETGRRLSGQLGEAPNAEGGERARISGRRELEAAIPETDTAIDPTRDPLTWIENELPDGGFLPGERERATELLAEGNTYWRVRYSILDARNARPKSGLRHRVLAAGTPTVERTTT